MRKTKIILAGVVASSLFFACKKELDIQNPNLPTPESAKNETGVVSLAQGGTYINGFFDLKYTDGVYGRFWSGAMGFHELMADVIGAEAANAYMQQIGCPDKVTLDNGTVVLSPGTPNTQLALLRFVNNNANQGANPTFYEWAYMYNLIVANNYVIDLASTTAFSGDAAAKKNTLIAWANFWKGFAYSRIGSTYYAGLIQNATAGTNSNYVTKEAIITESNACFDRAATILNTLTVTADYTAIVSKLIPGYLQTGRGGVITPAAWVRNINTLKARNILVNKTVAAMTATDWNAIITLANNGVNATDVIFTGRTNVNGDFLSTTVADKIQSSGPGGNTYKLSERWVSEFKTGDRRYTQNIKQGTTWLGNSDRGNAFNTRFTLWNGGNGVSGVKTYANNAPGANEISLAGTYEENQLMLAEAKIYTNAIDAGLVHVDNVRNYQGAGLAAVSGTNLSQTMAIRELRRERRVAIAFLGLSFYDARRWGIINPISQGGGRTGVNVINGSGVLSTNASIDYNFLDYWDVPDNELAYNPAGAGSAPVKNPK